MLSKPISLPDITPEIIDAVTRRNKIDLTSFMTAWITSIITNKEIAQYRSQDVCDAIGAMVRGHPELKICVEQNFIDVKTLTNYSQGAQRAFYHKRTWTPRAFQSEKNGGLPPLPWSQRSTNQNKIDQKKAKFIKLVGQVAQFNTVGISDLSSNEKKLIKLAREIFSGAQE